ncbi:MAG: ferritin [Anaerovoracaceae bacterium]|nr:ferritin [Anaerovoracaceae bacterium]
MIDHPTGKEAIEPVREKMDKNKKVRYITMLDKKVADLLNQQVNKELYSAYLYLDFSNYYYDEGLDGFGNWYKIQAQEERDHAMLFVQYLQNNGEKVVLEAIDKPAVALTGAKVVLEEGLKHEQYVTSLIHAIYDAAYSVKDFRTMQFLDWFVKEQGEEETNAEGLIKKFELFGGDPKGLYMLDNELGARVYSAPSLVL